MVKITIYVEGGGDTNTLRTKCRQGFSEFFKKLNFKPKIIACGSRQNAYDSFCIGLKNTRNNEYCLLLVDSEAPVNSPSVWQHVFLREGDKWSKPDKATEKHLHFMVECMEAWFMADKESLTHYYGQGFKKNALSGNLNPEDISKKILEDTLKKATCDTTKGKYDKGGHSFEILGKIDAHKVITSSTYAKKLVEVLNDPAKFLTLSR
ncbi:MAG: DUF4276 family protein [Methylobacter sp.]|nr:DUF4276 family protein [Methylobacter sp.]MDP2098481.1 DUF4276 family protein [Methylobacter sp.]MDP2427404.1 DUF4276 family protein [Methylobacter sp.]MDP3056229.1 DUF4276 family protein [Methylobacter sp.]MDP3361475.1 DUF4276 family protein [Methylobacter sp.]